MTLSEFQFKTLRYINDQLEVLYNWDEINKDALLTSLVLDAQQTIDKLRTELMSSEIKN